MNTLNKIFERQFSAMIEWCNSRLSGNVFYFSSDIRDAGFKITPVDANFFPAGFNLLTETSSRLSTEIIGEKYTNRKILLVIENHTRNLHYFKNVEVLVNILLEAGNQVRTTNLSQMDVHGLKIERVKRSKNRIVTETGYEPDLILINNDMISGEPEILSGIEQECIPHIKLGWFNRKKEDYFAQHDELLRDFCAEFDIDKWLLSAKLESCQGVDFEKRQGLECVAAAVDKLLAQIQEKYNEYKIQQKPYVFVKTSSGSYGIGVVSVDHPDEILNINKNLRKKMQVTKESKAIDNVIVQEGIQTVSSYNGYPSEILSYFVIDRNIATICRYNTLNDSKNNLNTKGMGFVDMKHDSKVLQIVNSLALIAAEKETYAMKADGRQ